LNMEKKATTIRLEDCPEDLTTLPEDIEIIVDDYDPAMDDLYWDDEE